MIGRKANKSDEKALQFKWGKTASKNSVSAITKYKAMKSAGKGEKYISLPVEFTSGSHTTCFMSMCCCEQGWAGKQRAEFFPLLGLNRFLPDSFWIY